MTKRVELESFLHDVTVNIELYRVRSVRVNICCSTFENLYSSVHSALQHIIPLCIDWERDGFISLNESEMIVVLHKLQSLFQENFTLELDNWSYSTRSCKDDSHIRCGSSLIIAQNDDQPQPIENIKQVSAYCGPSGLGASNKHLEMHQPTNPRPDPVHHGDSDGTNLMPVLEPITPPSPKTPDNISLIGADPLSDLPSEWSLDWLNGDVLNFDDIDKLFGEFVAAPPRVLQEITHEPPPLSPQQIDQFPAHVSSIHVNDEKPKIEEIYLEVVEDDDEWDLKLDEITKRFQATYDMKRGGGINKKRKVKSFGMSRQEKELIKSVLDEKPCEINKAERLKLLNRNLKMIKMFESLTRRIITFVDQPLKLLCDEI